MKRLYLSAMIVLLFAAAGIAQKLYTVSGASLDSKWANAQKQADQNGDDHYWIVYTFPRMMSPHSSIGTISHDWDGLTPLGNLLYPDRRYPIYDTKIYDKDDDKPPVEREVAMLFSMQGENVKEVLLSTLDLHVELQKRPLYFLGKSPTDKSIDLVIARYNYNLDIDSREHLMLAAGMHKGGDKAFKFLRSIADDDDENFEVRKKAIFWIAETEHEELPAYLVSFAKDRSSDHELAEKAVFSLHRLEEKGLDGLIDVAKNAPDSEVKQKAIFWIGQLASEKAADALEERVFSDEETDIQEKAVFALYQNDSGDRVKRLLRIAETHPNGEVRKKAVFWLGQLDEPEALDALLQIMGRK